MYALCIVMPYIVGMGLTILRVVVFVRVVLYRTWMLLWILYVETGQVIVFVEWGEGLLLYSTGHYPCVSAKAMEKG